MDSVTLSAPVIGGNAVRVLGYVEAFLFMTPIFLPRHSAPSEKWEAKEEQRIMGHNQFPTLTFIPALKRSRRQGDAACPLRPSSKNLRMCPHSPCKTDLGPGIILPLPLFSPIILANTSFRFSLQSTVRHLLSQLPFLGFRFIRLLWGSLGCRVTSVHIWSPPPASTHSEAESRS